MKCEIRKIEKGETRAIQRWIERDAKHAQIKIIHNEGWREVIVVLELQDIQDILREIGHMI